MTSGTVVRTVGALRHAGAVAVLTGALGAAAWGPAVAQDTTRAAVGSRVRVTASALRPAALVGRVERLTADSVWLRSDAGAPPLPLARSGVARVEVSRGYPGRTRRMWAVGALGAVLGGVTAWALAGPERCFDCIRDESERVYLTGTGAVLGLLAGAAVGAIGVREHWVPGRLGDARAPERRK